MKILITGSRTLTDADYPKLAKALEKLIKHGTVIVHGGADGADTLTERWCKQVGIESQVMKPNYGYYLPHTAPLMRNQAMVNMTTGTIAIIKGAMTRGTEDTIKRSRKRNNPVMIVNLQDESYEMQTALPL